jgi:phage shock protein PspC (stress-responsive transcriptional regulator)
MNEIKKIHLGRQPFTISVDAHKLLRAYLEAIEHQVGAKSEVIKEIESRMAELLIERGIHDDKVVLEDDVVFLKEQLGDPGDFKDDDHETEQTEASQTKRLFRDTQNGMIAGVCSGIAAYVGVDISIVRLIFVVALFFGGAAIPVYLLLWLVMPEAKTPSDRLQMQGKAVTVDSIKELVDRADVPAAARRANQTFGTFVGTIGRAILYLIGLTFIVSSLSMLITVAAAGSYMLIHGGQIAGQVVFPIGAEAVVGLACAVAVCMIIALGLFLLGMTMIKRRRIVPGWVVAVAVGLFIIASAAGTAIGFDIAPSIRAKYDSMHHTQDIGVAPFKNLDLNGDNTTFAYQPDSRYFVEAKYFGNTVHDWSFARQVQNSTLSIDASKYQNTDSCNFMCLYKDNNVQFVIHAPSLDAVHISGQDAFFRANQPMTQAKLDLKVDQGSFVELQRMKADTITFTQANSGAQEVTLTGLEPYGNSETETLNVSDDITLMDGVANTITYDTPQNCDDGGLLLSLQHMPQTLVLNGERITSDQQLLNLHNSDQQNAYNCVAVTQN